MTAMSAILKAARAAIAAGYSPDDLVHLTEDNGGISSPITLDDYQRNGYVLTYYRLGDIAARAALADARGLLPIDEVTADPDTGEWLTVPRFTGQYALASDWHLRTDTFVAHFDTYRTTRAIIVRWSD